MSEISHLDWWLQEGHRPNQPKLDIANYVESEGIPVPKRYATLDDALVSVADGETILLRSEHDDDYDGASGLFHSFRINNEEINYGKVVLSQSEVAINVDDQLVSSQSRHFSTPEIRQGQPGYGQLQHIIIGQIQSVDSSLTLRRLLATQSESAPIIRYTQLTRQDRSKFMEESSFSYWEYVSGTNIAVIADSSIDNRYHVLSLEEEYDSTEAAGQIINAGGEVILGDKYSPDFLGQEKRREIVELYEAVRNLPRFDSQHCPVVETQLDDEGHLWFLQYHRARDFEASTHSFNDSEYPSSEGWVKADAVRGSVGLKIGLKLGLWYPDYYGAAPSHCDSLPDQEDAGADWHDDHGLSEVMSRRRTAYVNEGSFTDIYHAIANRHECKSKWFKGATAISLKDKGLQCLIGKEILDATGRIVIGEGQMARVVIDLATDGINGYIRLNSDSDQPVRTIN